MAPSIPRATYRLQLTPNFGFAAAAAIVPYLRALGVSHLYASPFLKARSGSTHGYDVIDYGSLNPELGGDTAFGELCDALKQADIGLILDFVPNHMAIHHADNAWWLDVLEWGQNSPHAAAFDIDWRYFPGRQRVLIPILAAPYGDALTAGDIELRFAQESGTFSAWYYEHRLPIDPRCYAEILRTVVATAKCDASPLGRRLLELAERGGTSFTREAASKLKAELAALGDGADAIRQGLRAYQPAGGDPAASTALHQLLERQHYRLAHWRLAGSELNYRRFFDITTLAGLRMEHRATFMAVHALAMRLIENGQLHGLRIDHVDGLCDPQQYCRWLQRLVRASRPTPDGDIYVVVEKILADGEHLPPLAGVAGTTGYEWLNLISRVLVDDRGLQRLTRTWHESSDDARSFGDVLLAAKRDVMTEVLGSERAALLRLLSGIAAGHPAIRDYAGDRLRAAFDLFILHFPVYRTYVTAAGTSARDRETIKTALAKARAEWIGADMGIFDFLRDALTLDLIERVEPKLKSHVRRFAAKIQQFTGPMMAKALEDTAFYRYHRLLALNEVGGNPAAEALSIADFHARMEQRAAAPSQGLTATATHDTKRGEDARTRLLALTELAEEWANSVHGWRALNAGLVEGSERTRIPSHAHEYMLYQALLGAWPLDGVDHDFVARMIAYTVKAAREGKEETSWLAPDEKYERGLHSFLTELLDHRRSQRFIESFDAFARRAALLGALSSLVQVTLKTMMAGVPDFYEGSEFWDLSLVDPDNRRPVDFSGRASLLKSLSETIDWRALAAAWPDGRVKLALTHRLLEVRSTFTELFATGRYRPLEVTGPHRDDVIAFARIKEPDAVIVACGRRFAPRTEHGKRWPSGRDWEASLSLRDFADVENLLSDRAKMSRLELNFGEMFEPLPIACLRARCAS